MAVNWKSVFAVMTDEELLIDVIVMKEELAKKNKNLARLFAAGDSVFQRGGPLDALELYTLLLPVCDEIGVPVNVTAPLENELVGFYGACGLPELSIHVGRMRAAICGPPPHSRPSTDAWALVLAHLICVAHEPRLQTCEQMYRDVSFICARYAGAAFVQFAYMLRSVQLMCGFLPPRLVECIGVFLRIIRTEFNGAVPADFIYKPRIY